MSSAGQSSGTIPAPLRQAKPQPRQVVFYGFHDESVWSLTPTPTTTLQLVVSGQRAQKGGVVDAASLWCVYLQSFIWKNERMLPWLTGLSCTDTSSCFLGQCTMQSLCRVNTSSRFSMISTNGASRGQFIPNSLSCFHTMNRKRCLGD